MVIQSNISKYSDMKYLDTKAAFRRPLKCQSILKALLDRDAFASRSPMQNQPVRCICVATVYTEMVGKTAGEILIQLRK